MTEVDIRTLSSGGICDRRFPIDAVPHEVDWLKSTGKFSVIEVRAVGAAEWRQIHPTNQGGTQ